MNDRPRFPSTAGRKTDVVGNSVSCRLPHTPRTPSVGMAHYFDNIFHRQVDIGTPRRLSMPWTRRSSAARSIMPRSEFEGSIKNDDEDAASVNRSWGPRGSVRGACLASTKPMTLFSESFYVSRCDRLPR